MEREIVELRKQLADQKTPTKTNGSFSQAATQSGLYGSMDQYGSDEAVEGLMGLSGGLNTLKRIEDVLVTQDCVVELFNTQVPRSVFPPVAQKLIPLLNQFLRHVSSISPFSHSGNGTRRVL